MVGMMTDIGPGFNSAIHPTALANLKVKVMDSVYPKGLNSSYFSDHTMNLVYIWYDAKYWSKFLFSNVSHIAPSLPMALRYMFGQALLSDESSCLFEFLSSPKDRYRRGSRGEEREK